MYQSKVYGGVPPLAVSNAAPIPVSQAPVTVIVYANVFQLLNADELGVGDGDANVLVGVGVTVGVGVSVFVTVGVGVGVFVTVGVGVLVTVGVGVGVEQVNELLVRQSLQSVYDGV